MTGNDVLALQKLLVAQHYDPGALSGRFGYDTHHAVMAFQKLQRLPVTGRWGNAERLRATRPTAYAVRYPSAGRAVEISVTRQILVLSEGGVVRRVIDVSTGNNRYYTYDGRQRRRAHPARPLLDLPQDQRHPDQPPRRPLQAVVLRRGLRRPRQRQRARPTPPATAASGSPTRTPTGCSRC